MAEWSPEEQKPALAKEPGDIIASLFDQLEDANMRYALDQTQHDEWSAEMRRIDQKLGIFGLRLDRQERFNRTSGKL